MARRRLSWLVLVVSLSPLLSGCWDAMSIERLGFVETALVEGQPGHITAHLRTVVPSNLSSGPSGSSGAGQAQSTATYVGEGVDVMSAVRNADLHSVKRLYFGNVEAVLVADQLAASGGLPDVLDYFVRGTKTRNIAWVYIVHGQEVQRLMSLVPPGASYPAQAIVNLSLSQHTAGDVAPMRVFQALDCLLAAGRDASIPLLSVQGGNYALAGTALFRQDRLVGFLAPMESKAFTIVHGRSSLPHMPVPCGAGGAVGMELVHPKSRVGVQQDAQGHLALTVKIHSTARVDQVSSCGFNALSESSRLALAGTAASELEHQVSATLGHLQSADSDAVGFGEMLRAHYPEIWASLAPKWHQVYPKMPIVVQVHIAVDGTGMLNEGLS